MNKNQKFFNILGVVLVVICIGAFFLTKYHSEIFNNKYTSQTEKSEAAGSFELESDEIVYNGQGELDLMQGVKAYNGEGKDITDKVSAVVTAEGTMGRKIVRYSFEDSSGKTVTKKRTLVLKNYRGPSLDVSSSIKINAKDLKDIINILHKSGELKADDGYSKDITSSVTCIREKLYTNTYKMTFNVTNAYGDSVSKSVDVFITGDVKDPEIKLAQDSIKLRKGTEFKPESLISYAFDGNGESIKNVEIDAKLDTSTAGTYSVIYTIYNSNRTASATKKLTVIVED